MPTIRGEWTAEELQDFVLGTLIDAERKGRKFMGWATNSGELGDNAALLGNPEKPSVPMARKFYVGDYVFLDDILTTTAKQTQ